MLLPAATVVETLLEKPVEVEKLKEPERLREIETEKHEPMVEYVLDEDAESEKVVVEVTKTVEATQGAVKDTSPSPPRSPGQSRSRYFGSVIFLSCTMMKYILSRPDGIYHHFVPFRKS